MKIFLVLSNFPYAKGEAIEVVSYEVIQLMAKAGHQLDVQVIIREGRTPLNEERQRRAFSSLSELDVNFLSTIFLGDSLEKKSMVSRKFLAVWNLIRSLPLLRRKIDPYLFPATRLLPQVKLLVNKCQSDIILSIWSWEALAATYNISDVPKFVYYGNPDHKPTEARLNHPDLFDIQTVGVRNRVKYQISRLRNRAREVQHLKMMKRCETTANNSLFDTEYYKNCGHPQSIYLQNMWPKAKKTPFFGGACSNSAPFKIIGSVGNLGATGNTFGLYFIGNDLAPKLEEKFGMGGIVIDVFGGGIPTKKVSSVLNRPSIRLRGWVNDIEQEIQNSCAFLVLTNVNGFIVGNTRVLLAWSLGACLIAHTNSLLSMPEIAHMENALIGETADEIADLIYMVTQDSEFRTRIGRGGYETYLQYYSSDIVVPKMLNEMGFLVSSRREKHFN